MRPQPVVLAFTGALLFLLPGVPLSSLAAQDRNGSDPAASAAEARTTEDDDAPQARRPTRRKRPRISNVGYVDPAVIGTQLQIRFDRARGLTRPDRAEFIYGKCGCFREAGLDPDAPGPSGPLNGGDPETTPFMVIGLKYTDVVLDAEVAVNERVSLFAEVPWRQVDLRVEEGTPGREESGLADVTAGVKAALVSTEDRLLTAQLRTYLPTGDAEKGLGTDHVSLEPGLLFFQRLTSALKAEAELRLWVPVGGSDGTGTPGFDESDDYAGSILRYGLGVSVDINRDGTVMFSPVAELVGWSVLGGLVANSSDATFADLTVDEASGTNILNLKLGANVSFGESSAVFLGLGTAVSDESHYDRILRVEYRLAL